jgi:LacI family transcriptional regulator
MNIFTINASRSSPKNFGYGYDHFEIALDLGLSDSKNIARQFKQIKGLLMEYRKKHMKTKQSA